MSEEVAGIPLPEFTVPIRTALHFYTEITDGDVTFEDIKAASQLRLTPEKPNSARNETTVRHLGENIGTLVVIAFAPFDGTGDESTHNLRDVTVDRAYPRERKLVPRSKAKVHTEAMLSIMSQDVYPTGVNPDFFDTNLDLMGFDDNGVVTKIAELGQPDNGDHSSLRRYATATVGYLGLQGELSQDGERFASEHALCNPWRDQLQVCGFLALSHEVVAKGHFDVFQKLNVHVPDFKFQR